MRERIKLESKQTYILNDKKNQEKVSLSQNKC